MLYKVDGIEHDTEKVNLTPRPAPKSTLVDDLLDIDYGMWFWRIVFGLVMATVFFGICVK